MGWSRQEETSLEFTLKTRKLCSGNICPVRETDEIHSSIIIISVIALGKKGKCTEVVVMLVLKEERKCSDTALLKWCLLPSAKLDIEALILV